jgi:hypothetical protein
MTRPLTAAELAILRIAQDNLGPHNTADDVFINEDNGAVIFAKNAAGESCIMLHLTNLAEWVAEGVWSTEAIVRDIQAAR